MDWIEFVFVHSYSSRSDNWLDVMVGTDDRPGRLLKAWMLAKQFDVPVMANDAYDSRNADLLTRFNAENLMTAKRTQDEVRSALAYSHNGRVLFVTSPDHLPRVVRDVLAAGGVQAVFAASAVPFSTAGVESVVIDEPPH